MAACAYNPSTQQVEAGRSGAQGHPGLHTMKQRTCNPTDDEVGAGGRWVPGSMRASQPGLRQSSQPVRSPVSNGRWEVVRTSPRSCPLTSTRQPAPAHTMYPQEHTVPRGCDLAPFTAGDTYGHSMTECPHQLFLATIFIRTARPGGRMGFADLSPCLFLQGPADWGVWPHRVCS